MSFFNNVFFCVLLLCVVKLVNGGQWFDVRVNTESKSGTFQCSASKTLGNDKSLILTFSDTSPSQFIATFRDDVAVCETLEHEDLPCSLKEATVNTNDVDGSVIHFFNCEYCVTDPNSTSHTQESEKLGQQCERPHHLFMYSNEGSFGCYQCCQNYNFDYERHKKCTRCQSGQGTRGPGAYPSCLGHDQLDPIPPLFWPGLTTTTTTRETTHVELTTKPTASTPASTSRPSSTTPQVKDTGKPRVCRPINLVVSEPLKAYTVSLVWKCSGGAQAEKFIVIVDCGKGQLTEEVKEMDVQLSHLAPDTRCEAKIATVDDKGMRYSIRAHFQTAKKPPSHAVDESTEIVPEPEYGVPSQTIVGIVIGSIIGLCIVLALIIYIACRKKRETRNVQGSQQDQITEQNEGSSNQRLVSETAGDSSDEGVD